jgi:hypothetical protein
MGIIAIVLKRFLCHLECGQFNVAPELNQRWGGLPCLSPISVVCDASACFRDDEQNWSLNGEGDGDEEDFREHKTKGRTEAERVRGTQPCTLPQALQSSGVHKRE